MIQSVDNLISSISGGKTSRFDFNKITAGTFVAGRCYDLAQFAGSPVATAYPGTALTWVTTNDATGDGTNAFGMWHGGDVSTDVKSLLNMALQGFVATAVPSTLMLVDMQGYYPGVNMNSLSAQTLLGTPTLRYTNGVGLRAFLAARATTGASAHNIAYNYNNQAGTGHTNPVTVAASVSSVAGTIVHSGIAANNYGPFLPMASGDTGIRQFNTITLSAASGTASTAALVLCKPLAQISIGVVGLMTEKDLVNQIPSMPIIKDGACLTWILVAGAATAAATTFTGSIEAVWG